MNINIGTNISGNYNTGLYNLLFNLPRDILFHNEHKLREPLGIYIVSIRRVLRAFENILSEINKTDINLEKLDLTHKELLDSIMAYIDDGYLIMKCFYPSALVKEDIIFADKWVRKVDKNLITEYKKNIEPYRNKLALIVNKTKHNHARYCHVETTSLFGKVLGYYIEGVDEGGAILPDNEIHPMYNGMHTAISYNKDIKDQLVNLYFISHFTAGAIKKIILKNHGITLNTSLHKFDDDERIINIIEEILSLRELYFLDEYDENLPQITRKEGLVELRKPPYKSYVSKLVKPSSFKIKTMMSGDSVTKSWTLPYF